MIKEAYCSYEVSKLLEEKGFLKGVNLRLIPNIAFYDNIGLQYNVAKWYDSLIQDKIDFVIAPTHQMAIKWLREEKNIIINVWYNGVDWNAEYYNNEDENFYLITDYSCNSYEEAVEVALKYVLKNLI